MAMSPVATQAPAGRVHGLARRRRAGPAAALRVFHELRWTGLASADFIRRGCGSYAFLEVNPRPWGSIAAARSAGVDLFTPFAELLVGACRPRIWRSRPTATTTSSRATCC